MFDLFQQIRHKLGIEQYRSSAYHPNSQGELKHFHQFFKIYDEKIVINFIKIGTMVLILFCLLSENLIRIPLVSSPLNLFLVTLLGDH